MRTKISVVSLCVRKVILGCISLLLPKLPSQCCSNGLGNLGNLSCSREIHPYKIILTFWEQTQLEVDSQIRIFMSYLDVTTTTCDSKR